MDATPAAIHRYEELRALRISLGEQIQKTLPKRALDETPKKLGLHARGQLPSELDD